MISYNTQNKIEKSVPCPERATFLFQSSCFSFICNFNTKGLPLWLNNKESFIFITMQEIQETWVQFLGQKDPLKEGMATHFSILAWTILWTEETGELQSIGVQRVGHD